MGTCVPDLNFDAFVAFKGHHFGTELNSHSRCHVLAVLSSTFDEAIDNVGLAYICVACEND